MGIFKPNVKKLAAKRNVKGLAEVLEDKNEEVRNSAAKALRSIGTEEASEAVKAYKKRETTRHISSNHFRLRGIYPN